MSKLAPRRYGDRLLVAGDPENPIQHLHAQVSLNDLSYDELDALETFCNKMISHQAAPVVVEGDA